jgi:predicted phage baseplate assembly protein
MNNPLGPTLRELNDCGCCAGTGAQTPAASDNRAGLPAVLFRAGVHSQFKASLLAALSSQAHPALRALRTREDGDFTIALLDAFAGMADVLTFYSERIANESFLRTATERRSVLEMARAIGYELEPGVAAKVMLAFNVEGGAGAPGTAIIPKGTKVQSIPGPGEKPQVFETSVEFTAQAAWNELRPRLREAPLQGASLLAAAELYLDGTATTLKPGDVLVLSATIPAPDAKAGRVAVVELDRERNHTKVTLEGAGAARSMSAVLAPAAATVAPPALTAGGGFIGLAPTATVVEGLFARGVTSLQLHELSHFQHWDPLVVQSHLNSLPKVVLSTPDAGVFALRARAGFFGHNAPKWGSLPRSDAQKNDPYGDDWDDFEPGHQVTKIWQDSQHHDLNGLNATSFDVLMERPLQEVLAESWLVLETESATLVPLRVGRNSELSRADYGMSAKCARLNLKGVDGASDPKKEAAYTTRGTTAHLQSEPLTVTGAPITSNLSQGQTALPLDRIDARLFIGQSLALQGEDADLPGTTQREIIVIAAIQHTDVTTLTLRAGLLHNYKRPTVTLNANVVSATHGETTEEVLGGGDATQPFQRFILKQKPVTYAFPPDGSVLESSLEIWVDNVQWAETPSFFGRGPKNRVYIVRRADDGTAIVQFGDGRTGARLPTGRENVRAVYRKGIGLDVLVKPDQISLLLTQPLGVKGVKNLLAPEGAENAQSLDDARVNAPRTVLTLDRIVSLQDYEDFARDFPGVEKAHAVWTWSGQTRGVLLTLLGPGGSLIGETGQPADPLRKALAEFGNARVPVRITSRPPSLFRVAGVVKVESDRVPSVVEAAVRAALLAAFSFAAREFGQGAALSEVIAVIQNVPGVAFVDVTGFSKTAFDVATRSMRPSDAQHGYLHADKPANGTDAALAEPAELLILDEISLPQLEVSA